MQTVQLSAVVRAAMRVHRTQSAMPDYVVTRVTVDPMTGAERWDTDMHMGQWSPDGSRVHPRVPEADYPDATQGGVYERALLMFACDEVCWLIQEVMKKTLGNKRVEIRGREVVAATAVKGWTVPVRLPVLTIKLDCSDESRRILSANGVRCGRMMPRKHHIMRFRLDDGTDMYMDPTSKQFRGEDNFRASYGAPPPYMLAETCRDTVLEGGMFTIPDDSPQSATSLLSL